MVALALFAGVLLARERLPAWSGDPRYWWRTPDQTGAALYRAGEFAAAKGHFLDSAWRGAACYRAGDWSCAEAAFAAVTTDVAVRDFNRGNTAVRAGQLTLAVQHYDAALRARPAWAAAQENRALVLQALAAREQRKNDGSADGEPTLPPDGVDFGKKDKRGKPGRIEIEKLDSDAIARMWLRTVRTDPGAFLRLRFAEEARQADTGTGTAAKGAP